MSTDERARPRNERTALVELAGAASNREQRLLGADALEARLVAVHAQLQDGLAAVELERVAFDCRDCRHT